ncbi:hypothetical protein A6C57_27235 (plasmid) [Fibrella sp. ES10-3-2-2]
MSATCWFTTYLLTIYSLFDSTFFAGVSRLVGQVKLPATARRQYVLADTATYLSGRVDSLGLSRLVWLCVWLVSFAGSTRGGQDTVRRATDAPNAGKVAKV